jgi:hypothetical protein
MTEARRQRTEDGEQRIEEQKVRRWEGEKIGN